MVTFVTVSKCLEVTRLLTKQLQSSTIDDGAAQEKVNLLVVMMNKMRLHIDARHNLWFNESAALPQGAGALSEKSKRQRPNVPDESVSAYF